jgi:hypothetical protein
LNSIGASSFPSPMTTTPFIRTVPRTGCMASTAACRPVPVTEPQVLEHAMAAASVARTSSNAISVRVRLLAAPDEVVRDWAQRSVHGHVGVLSGRAGSEELRAPQQRTTQSSRR